MAGVLKWLLFGVFIGLFPVGFNGLFAAINDNPITWATLLGRGELLPLALGLSGSAVGDLLVTHRGWDAFKVGVSFFALAIIAYSAALYGHISFAVGEDTSADRELVVVVSLMLYAGAIVISGACTAMARRRE